MQIKQVCPFFRPHFHQNLFSLPRLEHNPLLILHQMLSDFSTYRKEEVEGKFEVNETLVL